MVYSVIAAQAGIEDFSIKKKTKMDTGLRR
jgi:hypothetical protein